MGAAPPPAHGSEARALKHLQRLSRAGGRLPRRGIALAKVADVRRLLLVDDEANVLVGMRRYFSKAGFEVDCAREREEAEALLTHVDYDCVVLDLGLTPAHGADGLEVIGFVRERCPSVRVVVLSASGAPESRAEAARLGADLYLRKPQPLAAVSVAIRSLLGEATT